MAARVSNDISKRLAKIMIVDDERDIALVLKQGLEQNGFLVKAFTDPEEALEEFRQHSESYCLALVDIRMPKITGFQLVRELDTLNPDVKKVLMSSFEIHKNELTKVMPSTKVDDFVTKPISIRELKAVILKHIADTKTVPESKE